MYQLLSATPSPFARKVRIAMHEKNIDFELLTEVPWNNDAAAQRINPLGKIPVLILDDGTRYYESSFIVEYLELTHPEKPLIPADAEGRLLHRRFEVLNDGLCDALVLALIERTREEGRPSDHWVERQRGKAQRALAEVASLVDEGSTWSTGETFGLADCALGSTLGYMDLRFPDIDWRKSHPVFEPLFERMSARDSFQKTVPSAQTITDVVA